MSITSCSCTAPSFPNLGRPTCVIRKKKTKMIAFQPRYKEDGTENVIDASSATIGTVVRNLILASTPALERLYLSPVLEDVTYARTETAYKTAAGGKKFKLDGEGNVYTFRGMLMGDEGVEQMARELQKLGCSEFNMFEFTTDGNIWGVLDDVAVADLRGYHIDKETFDAFIVRAVDGDINAIDMSFDFEDAQDLVDSYAITSEELGYRSTTLRPLITATCVAVEATNTTIVATITTGFGTAGTPGTVKGLLAAAFTVTADGVLVTPITSVETADGVYTITHDNGDVSAADEVIVAVSATGYDVASGTFTATS